MGSPEPNWKCPSCGVPPFAEHKESCPIQKSFTKLADLPDSGMSTMTEAMIGAYEIYRSHIEAGFTEKQALWLVAAMMNPNFGQPPEGPTD